MARQNPFSRFVGRVGDQIADRAAGVVATAIITALIGVLAFIWTIMNNDSRGILLAGLFILIVVNVFWALLVLRLRRHGSEAKSGNLYWLCRDLMVLESKVRDLTQTPTKRELDHYLHQCCHHADKLAMTEKNIVGRLDHLKREARNYSQNEWTHEKRMDISQSLQSILNDIGRVAEERQTDFDPGTGLL